MEIVGLSGYARSGKDEAAKVLVEEFGFTRVAFADKLREVLYQLNPILDARQVVYGTTGWNETPTVVTQYTLLQNVIDAVGWDNYKSGPHGPEIRRLLQRLGTEAGRQTLWDSIWVDAAFANATEDSRIVVTDCRFPNEAEAIKSRGGVIWRIERRGVGPAVGTDGTVHPSETSLDDWKFDDIIYNTGPLDAYHRKIRKVYESRI